MLVQDTHHAATGESLAGHTAVPFGSALLDVLREECRNVEERSGAPLRLIRVSEPDELLVLAGRVESGAHMYTSVNHLIRSLLLEDPDSPAPRLSRRWLTVPSGQPAQMYRDQLRLPAWHRHIHAHVNFLAQAHWWHARGATPSQAQRAAAATLAQRLHLTFITEGEGHWPADVAPRDPAALH
ncbi:hypothetical protein [Deinococcus multiflagellatus]